MEKIAGEKTVSKNMIEDYNIIVNNRTLHLELTDEYVGLTISWQVGQGIRSESVILEPPEACRTATLILQRYEDSGGKRP